MKSEEHDIRVLNRLIEVTIDSMLGYAEAATDAARPEFRDLFDRRAIERQRLMATMQKQVQRLGGVPADVGTLAASVQRVFVDLRTALGKGERAVLAEMQRGENHIMSRYEEVVRDDTLSTPVRQLVQDAYRDILESQHEMRELKRNLQG